MKTRLLCAVVTVVLTGCYSRVSGHLIAGTSSTVLSSRHFIASRFHRNSFSSCVKFIARVVIACTLIARSNWNSSNISFRPALQCTIRLRKHINRRTELHRMSLKCRSILLRVLKANKNCYLEVLHLSKTDVLIPLRTGNAISVLTLSVEQECILQTTVLWRHWTVIIMQWLCSTYYSSR